MGDRTWELVRNFTRWLLVPLPGPWLAFGLSYSVVWVPHYWGRVSLEQRPLQPPSRGTSLGHAGPPALGPQHGSPPGQLPGGWPGSRELSARFQEFESSLVQKFKFFREFCEIHEISELWETRGFCDRCSGTDCESVIGWWENCNVYSLFCIFIIIIIIIIES